MGELITDPEHRFRIEMERDGCERCGHGRMYEIVDVVEDCAMLGMAWSSEEDAEEYLDAIRAGYEAAEAKWRPVVEAWRAVFAAAWTVEGTGRSVGMEAVPKYGPEHFRRSDSEAKP